jgi:hypothetical protein
MSATSFCEVTMTPFTEKAGINVQVHLPDICHRSCHSGRCGVRHRRDKLFPWMMFRLPDSSLCPGMEKHLKVIRFASVGQHLKYMRAHFWVWIASQHSFVHHRAGTWCGLTNDEGTDCSEALDTVKVNLSTMESIMGKEVPSIWQVVRTGHNDSLKVYDNGWFIIRTQCWTLSIFWIIYDIHGGLVVSVLACYSKGPRFNPNYCQ